MQIRKASPREIEKLLEIYVEKVVWLREANIPLWDESQFTIENLTAKYVDPEFFVGVVDDAVIGGFILVERDDEYWPDNAGENAYYFHKFVIKNGHGSLGYSGKMLDWVKEYGRKNGKDYLRLDFDETREYVKNMYESNGFIPVDRVHDKKGKPLIKAEFAL